MTQEELHGLREGDIIRGASGDGYVVVSSVGTKITAVKSVDVTNADEWTLFSRSSDAGRKANLRMLSASGLLVRVADAVDAELFRLLDEALWSCQCGCEAERSLHADMLRVLDGECICEDCYSEIDSYTADEMTPWSDLPPFEPFAAVTRAVNSLRFEPDRLAEQIHLAREAYEQFDSINRQANAVDIPFEGLDPTYRRAFTISTAWIVGRVLRHFGLQ